MKAPFLSRIIMPAMALVLYLTACACSREDAKPGTVQADADIEVYDPQPAFVIYIPEELVTETTVSYSVSPTDKEMTYVTMMFEKTYFDKFDSTDDFIQDNIRMFEEYAYEYELPVDVFLEQYVLLRGDIKLMEIPDNIPGNDYVVVAYGLSPQLEVLSELYYEFVTTQDPEIFVLDMTFQFSYAVDGPDVTASVVPSDNENLYLFDVMKQSEYVDLMTLYRYYQAYICDMLVNADLFGISAEVYMRSIASQGPADFVLSLEPCTAYVGFAMAVGLDGAILSEPCVGTFTTGEGVPSGIGRPAFTAERPEMVVVRTPSGILRTCLQ